MLYLEKIRRNIGTKSVMGDNGKRNNNPEYPMKALGEIKNFYKLKFRF